MIAGKLPENDVILVVSVELKAFLEDDEEGYILEDKKVAELMQELLKEINGGSDDKNVEMLGSSSSFYISGESCGPAFSGSGSTLMAGIEMGCGSNSAGGGGGGNRDNVSLEAAGVGLGGPDMEVFSGLEVGFSVYNGPWLVEGKGKEKNMQEEENEEEVEREKMDGCDEEEGEDEWLTRVLSYAPQVLDDYGM
ncbi:hypothetical protein RND71_014153 [Anisodus tanguticus]|uniref:Uncharacterized protein n=1 Tax=Anisodus tanguticus TaxID=243964 RepID=A0AAE1SBC4_9SOLA|nr:hypothetical protein RND71_014153 [Anisodus tanguticus]